jgi:hypothetical protein
VFEAVSFLHLHESKHSMPTKGLSRPLVVGVTIGLKMKNEPKHSLPDEGEST